MTDPNGASSSVLLTVVLRHDEAIALEERNAILAERGWWDSFPPKSCDVVAWYFAMGLGHVVVLRVPTDKVAELNVEIQRSCWGAYFTDFYLSYDFKPLREEIANKQRR